MTEDVLDGALGCSPASGTINNSTCPPQAKDRVKAGRLVTHPSLPIGRPRENNLMMAVREGTSYDRLATLSTNCSRAICINDAKQESRTRRRGIWYNEAAALGMRLLPMGDGVGDRALDDLHDMQ
ncbi:hypothetical protein NM208_g14099 [Fusarium decemcellulare]|uniref:Uncharacterized protein n=1 Tax=Fusarium decemcellulare TaxID=57161 RepID=A0ACC1RKV4_9HYPO|nr:hypothetical protein NM208_g14099 [Fusarium decemcellulare]